MKTLIASLVVIAALAGTANAAPVDGYQAWAADALIHSK